MKFQHIKAHMLDNNLSIKYEIHVNGYEIGKTLGQALFSLGFHPDDFDRSTITDHAPPHHFTFVTYENRHQLNEVWRRVLAVINADENFRGYIEAETVPDSHRRIFEERPFEPVAEFPFPACKKPHELPAGQFKASDIHIARSLDRSRDELDDLLRDHNFYEVHWRDGNGEAERIFTYQTEYAADAKSVYQMLCDYLEKVGGPKQLDLEITSMFFRKPADFPVPKVVPKGFFSESRNPGV